MGIRHMSPENMFSGGKTGLALNTSTDSKAKAAIPLRKQPSVADHTATAEKLESWKSPPTPAEEEWGPLSRVFRFARYPHWGVSELQIVRPKADLKSLSHETHKANKHWISSLSEIKDLSKSLGPLAACLCPCSLTAAASHASLSREQAAKSQEEHDLELGPLLPYAHLQSKLRRFDCVRTHFLEHRTWASLVCWTSDCSKLTPISMHFDFRMTSYLIHHHSFPHSQSRAPKYRSLGKKYATQYQTWESLWLFVGFTYSCILRLYSGRRNLNLGRLTCMLRTGRLSMTIGHQLFEMCLGKLLPVPLLWYQGI
ncbi:uncharacterized protein LOC116263668 [Nymphaea colorata]|nr:uncharacterized protein LOC116263668 [Nymphaea colorata]